MGSREPTEPTPTTPLSLFFIFQEQTAVMEIQVVHWSGGTLQGNLGPKLDLSVMALVYVVEEYLVSIPKLMDT